MAMDPALPQPLIDLYRTLTGSSPLGLTPLPASGSGRRYFRLEGQPTVMGVCGESVDENRAFIYLSHHLRSRGLPVPEVLAVSGDELSYLQEDLGNALLFDAIVQGRQTGCFSQAERNLLRRTIRLLPRVQFLGAQGLDFSRCYPQPAFDERTVRWDLNYFKYCFLKATGIPLREDLLEDDFDRLTANLLNHRHSYAFMLRDFQSRNVMIRDGQPWIIDFQGGRFGPCLYDLASFLWQARAKLPPALRQELLGDYLDALRQYLPQIDEQAFAARLRHFVAFRILQTLGAYGFRGWFERKPHFIQSIPPALVNLRHELLDLATDYPYLQQLIADIDLPALSVQPTDGTAQTATKPPLTVHCISFSYRRGLPDDPWGNGGGYIFDCRAIHNPGRYDAYKQMTGMDAPVIRFLEDDGGAARFLNSVYALVDGSVERYLQRGFTHLSVAFGCTGGQHRSVYCACQLAHHLRERYPSVCVELIHREQQP